MSGLKSQTEEGIAPAVEETKLGQARLQESLKQAELDRSQQASLLHALQAQMSSLSQKITSMVLSPLGDVLMCYCCSRQVIWSLILN